MYSCKIINFRNIFLFIQFDIISPLTHVFLYFSHQIYLFSSFQLNFNHFSLHFFLSLISSFSFSSLWNLLLFFFYFSFLHFLLVPNEIFASLLYFPFLLPSSYQWNLSLFFIFSFSLISSFLSFRMKYIACLLLFSLISYIYLFLSFLTKSIAFLFSFSFLIIFYFPLISYFVTVTRLFLSTHWNLSSLLPFLFSLVPMKSILLLFFPHFSYSLLVHIHILPSSPSPILEVTTIITIPFFPRSFTAYITLNTLHQQTGAFQLQHCWNGVKFSLTFT